jgi:hypothetical protein
MKAQQQVERQMDEYLVKKSPFQLPENGKKAIVQYIPYLALLGGILSFLSAWGLWRLGHRVNELAQSVNDFARSYGVETTYTDNQLGVFYYVALLALVAQGALMLYAYPGLKERSKTRGWDILLYSTLAGFLYGVFVAITNQGTLFHFLSSLVGALIGLYLLAQCKPYYTPKVSKKAAVK